MNAPKDADTRLTSIKAPIARSRHFSKSATGYSTAFNLPSILSILRSVASALRVICSSFSYCSFRECSTHSFSARTRSTLLSRRPSPFLTGFGQQRISLFKLSNNPAQRPTRAFALSKAPRSRLTSEPTLCSQQGVLSQGTRTARYRCHRRGDHTGAGCRAQPKGQGLPVPVPDRGEAGASSSGVHGRESPAGRGFPSGGSGRGR